VKVLRSYYTDAMKAQYHGLGPHYVHAAVELRSASDGQPARSDHNGAWRLEWSISAWPLNVEIHHAEGIKPHELDVHYRSRLCVDDPSLNNTINGVTDHQTRIYICNVSTGQARSYLYGVYC